MPDEFDLKLESHGKTKARATTLDHTERLKAFSCLERISSSHQFRWRSELGGFQFGDGVRKVEQLESTLLHLETLTNEYSLPGNVT